jgi:6-phosphogluconolactonase (cycloisomerase 2 family)
VIAALAVAGAAFPSAAAAAARGGWVYTETNSPSANSVLALDYGKTGSLAPIRVRAFPAGGTGKTFIPGQSAGAFNGDQQVTLSPDHKLLFAVNQGSDTIAVFKVDPSSGALRAVPGSPFPAGGDGPSSVASNGKFLVVANKGQDPGDPPPGAGRANYVSFKVAPTGRLSQLTAITSTGTSPMEVTFAPGGNVVFGADFFAFQFRSFALSTHGALTEAPGSPGQFPASVWQDRQPPPGLPPDSVKLPFGIAVHPTKPLVYYIAAVASRLTTYSYAASGAMTFVGQTDDSGAIAPCWLVVSPNGRLLFQANTVTSDVSTFDLSSPRAPRLIGHTPIKTPGPPTNVATDAAGKTLFVMVGHDDPDFPRATPNDGNFIETFKIGSAGTLRAVSHVALPVEFSALPAGLATLQKP